jgi:hypothetical protein
MSVFFNGRLWISPATMSAVDDSAMGNKNLTVGNVVALIGASEGGEPNTALRFGSAEEAEAVLRSGELLTAIKMAFDPSSETGSPAEIVAVRVNPAVQASLSLLDGSSNPVITLTSSDYGLYTNQIKVKVESGSTSGKKVTAQLGNDYYSQDNLARNAFQIQYTGVALTAVMSISNSAIVLQAPSGSTVATIDLNTYKTVQQVVDRINSVANFTASVLDGNGQTAALNGLDSATSVDVKTSAATATANLQAVVDWINSIGEGFIDAARVTNAGTLPANIGFTYLSGGSDGTITNTQWSNAYTTLQTVDAQWVTPVSSDPAIHAMNDTHCAFMSNVGRRERRGLCGMPLSSSDSAALTAAKALNSDRTSLVHLGHYDYDDNGNLTLFAPYMTAARIAGAFAGLNPGEPMTNKSIKVRGLERDLRNPTDTDVLITGGVLCVENTSNGYKVVKSITTWLNNDNYNRVEVSTGVALDFTVRNVREALDVLRGQKGGPLILRRAASITESALRKLSVPEPNGPGVLVGDADNPPYKNIRAFVEGDVLGVSFQCSPAIGVNYIPVSVFAVPFSGSATA